MWSNVWKAISNTSDLLEELLEHCEAAIDWLETQQTLIKDVTLPNYLQAHMEPGGD